MERLPCEVTLEWPPYLLYRQDSLLYDNWSLTPGEEHILRGTFAVLVAVRSVRDLQMLGDVYIQEAHKRQIQKHSDIRNNNLARN
jgi:hypothetical protein